VTGRAFPLTNASVLAAPRRLAPSIPLLVIGIAIAAILGLLLVRTFRQAPPATSTADQVPAKQLAAPAPTSSANSVAGEATDALASAPLASPTFSPRPPTASSDDSKDVLHRYYASFEAREPATAYGLLSAKFKAKLPYRKFSETFATTRAMMLRETRVVSSDQTSATVFVILDETEADLKRVQWEGPIELTRESDGWRIDTMRGLRKSADTSTGTTSSTKLPVAANPPARTPALSWDRPRLYLELANNAQRNRAVELKRRLTSSGYVVVTIDDASKNVDVPIEASELRYFTPADSAEAQRIAQELKPILGNVIAYLPEGMPYVSHSRQYEIWLSQAFR
jgi:hypothetical protein